MKENPQTELPNAPATEVMPTYIAPRPKRLERQGDISAPVTTRLPQVRGGQCEFCGVLDPNVPSQFQYKLCPHFRGLGQLRCSYCDAQKDPDDVIYHSTMNVAGHPDRPDQLIAWCNSYECSRKHLERFQKNA